MNAAREIEADLDHGDAAATQRARQTDVAQQVDRSGSVVRSRLRSARLVLEDKGYISDLLLTFGSTLVLVVPLIYIERSLTHRIGEVHDQLDDLRQRSQAIATDYERVRESERSGPRRTVMLEDQIRRARSQAGSREHDAASVAKMFIDGTEGERIAALGTMQADHSVADANVIVSGIENSRSAFEQWHALVLASDVWDALTEEDRAKVLHAIHGEMQPHGYLQPWTDRYGLAQQIIARA